MQFAATRRALARSPAFTTIAATSLALGIAAVTVIFALVDALLLRQLPVPRAERLVRIGTMQNGEGFNAVSHAEYLDIREGVPAFSGVLAHSPNDVVLTVGSQPSSASMEIVSGNYFDVLGIHPSPGRGFLPEEDRTPGERAVLVISHALWRGLFGADPGIVGRAVRVNGHPFEVVGVAPEDFTGTFAGFRIDLWIPVMMQAQALPTGGRIMDRDATFLMLIGRLADGATEAQAQAQLDGLALRFAAEYPRGEGERGFRLAPSGGIHPFIAGLVRAFLALLLGMVGIVLLIACANVANLMLVRVSTRRREIAVRAALGASRARVASVFLLEGSFIAILGGTAGMLVAIWATKALALWRPDVGIPLGLALRVDLRVAGFATAMTVGSALLFSFLPALHATAGSVFGGLREMGSGGPERSRLRGALVVAQVAMSALLLFGAVLLQQSLRRSRVIDPGFDASGITVLRAAPELLGYDESRGRTLWLDVMDRVRRVPGVRAVALGLFIPLGDRSDFMRIAPGDGRSDGELTHYTLVSPGYLDLLSIRLERGRDFAPADVHDGTPVAIVTGAFARLHWPDDDALGRSIRVTDRGGDVREATIVGITADIRYRSPGESPRPLVFLPFSQWYRPDMTLHVRAPAGIAAATLAAELHSIEPDLPAEIATMAEKTSFSLIPLQLASGVLGASGLIGLFLAVTGVFGVIAYTVSRELRDMAIRMALGAGAGRVRRLVVTRALRLTLLGLVIGLAAGVGGARLLGGLLYGVRAADPVSVGLVAFVFAGAALAASWPPARRASTLDPAIVLRDE